VLELLRGPELKTVVKERGSLAEDDARSLIRRLLEAVRYLHNNGVVHRDLKFENIVLAEDCDVSTATITDFGLACRVDAKDQRPRLLQCCGSPGFVAPEVINANRPDCADVEFYSSECDLWSLGVVLFVVLSGYPPFEGDNIREILKRVGTGAFTFFDPAWELVSSEAKDLVQGLMKSDPSARLTVDDALTHPWLNDC